jgi:hypothetical protein
MDSTLKSNLTVGPPAGPAACNEAQRLRSDHRVVCIDEQEPVLQIDPQHVGPEAAPGVRVDRGSASGGGGAPTPLLAACRYEPMKKITARAKDHAERPAAQRSSVRPSPRIITLYQPQHLWTQVLQAMTKFVFVTGGVVSSLGKGIAAASLAAILESRGLKSPSSSSIRI